MQLRVTEGSYRRDALASKDFKSPRAALLVKGGEEFNFSDFNIGSDTVVHAGSWSDNVFGTRRPRVYMQSRKGRFLHLGRCDAQFDNERATAGLDIGSRPLTCVFSER